MNYRAEIDGLRALAVLPVILFHAGFEWFSGGFVGVDVFFVISGYLITTIIISEMAEGKFSIVNFYERRARRILPALFFVMAVCLPFAWFWLSPSDLKDFGKSLIAVSIFSSNILFWLESGYFDTAAELKPLLHTWSLAVEEQYYILFPIFLMLTWRLGLKWILVLLSLIFVVSLGFAHWATNDAVNPKIISSAFFLLPARGWELLVGVFAAFYLKHNTCFKSHTVNQMLSLLGLGMVVYSIVSFDESTPFPSLYALVPTVGTGLLILSAVPNTLVHRLLSFSPIVGIGLISYSAYLWHQPLLAFARHRLLGEVSDLLLIVLCLASFGMAYISWRFVEKPFRDKKKTTRKFIFQTSLIGILVFTLLGLSGSHLIGYFSKWQPGNKHTFNRDLYSDERDQFKINNLVWSDNFGASEKKHYAVVGDSMWKDAVNILGFVDDFYYTPVFPNGGCPVTNEFDRYNLTPHCIELNLKRYSEDFSRFDGVIIISRNGWYDPNSLETFLEYLKKINVENILVFGNFIGFKDQSHFLDRVSLAAGGEQKVDDFVKSRRLLTETYQNDDAYIRLKDKYGFEFVSFYQSFCSKNLCPIYYDGVPFTYDVHHFTLDFSKMVATKNREVLLRFSSAK